MLSGGSSETDRTTTVATGETTADQTMTTEGAATKMAQTAKLAPGDGDSRDEFGSTVALSADGTTALVGAKNDEDPNGEGAGSAYVFTLANGDWSQQTKLAAEDGDEGDWFGWSVALSADGTTALVGAKNDEDPNGEALGPDSGAGSAYVFTRADGDWTQQAKLAADHGDAHDEFGTSVALSTDGTTALVGAHFDEDPNGTKRDPPDPTTGAGSAYVFARANGDWSQQAKLAADDGNPQDYFGSSVALSGDGTTALLGAWHDENPNGDLAGSAYVFVRTDGDWSQQTKLAADDGDHEDTFGGAVTLSGDGTTALVGADNDEDPNGKADDPFTGAGSAYVFARANGDWSQQAKLAADDGNRNDNFGSSVALSGDGTTALLGAWHDMDPNGENGGSAYVFSWGDGDWSQQAKLAADDGDSLDGFGWSVALSNDGTTALLGAATDEDPNDEDAGSSYVFQI